MSKIPKTVYITVENEGRDDEYFGVSKTLDEVAVIGETVRVAVFELKELREVTATPQSRVVE